MVLTNDKQLQMRVSDEFLEKVDEWRRSQKDLPGRSEAIRRLVEIALASSKDLKPNSPMPSTGVL